MLGQAKVSCLRLFRRQVTRISINSRRFLNSDSKNIVLPGVTNPKDLIADFEREWEGLSRNKLPLSQQIFERVKQDAIITGMLETPKLDNTPLPSFDLPKSLEISGPFYAIGGRKSSKAYVLITPNLPEADVVGNQELSNVLETNSAIRDLYKRSNESGQNFFVNGKSIHDYLFTDFWIRKALEPLSVTNTMETVKVFAWARGGGRTGQSDAIKLGISRALIKSEPLLKKLLKQHGFLTRDSRRVERKKPGQKKARKKFAWVKR